MPKFKCTIKRMFNGCPKPDGWFGCFAHIRGDDGDIRLTGKTTLPLTAGLSIEVEADEAGDHAYNATSVAIVTKTSTGLTAYLQSLPGISRVTARKIVEKVGIDAIDIIKQGEAAVEQMSQDHDLNLTKIQIKNLVGGVNSISKKNNLMQFVPELAGSPKLIKRIELAFDDPVKSIKEDPYCLLDVNGVTFPTIDAIAVRLGVAPISIERFGPAMAYLMQTDSSGNMFINLSDDDQISDFMVKLERLLNIRFESLADFGRWLQSVVQSGHYGLYIDHYKNEYHLYLKEIYNSMTSIHNHLVGTLHKATPFTDVPGAEINSLIKEYSYYFAHATGYVINLVKEQRETIHACLRAPISIITGGPGRGKTTLIDCLSYAWILGCGHHNVHNAGILLLAPTGKAMNKLRSATRGVYTTKTIDSILVEVKHFREKSNHPARFKYDSPDYLVIVDESSMLDMKKGADLLEALPHCSFCFVGDIDQLPPIGPGSFFKELLDIGNTLGNNTSSALCDTSPTGTTTKKFLPTSYLTTPLRNSGAILSNADKINANNTDITFNFDDFQFYPQPADDQDALQVIIETYSDEKAETPDIADLVMLCPMKKGTTGTDSINIAVQSINCPENAMQNGSWDQHRSRNMISGKGYPIPDTIFGNATNYTRLRVGDMIINTKNNYNTSWYKYSNNDYFNGKAIETGCGIFNGDCGKIIAYVPPADPSAEDDSSHSFMIVELIDGRFLELDITAGDAESIELGYALTVHKAQGCEYNTVIYISPERILNLPKNGFANKNLVYTAITRAKKKVVVIGSKPALNLCIESSIPARNVNFAERFIEEAATTRMFS